MMKFELLNVYNIGDYKIEEYADDELNIKFKGYVNGKKLIRVHNSLDACLLDCICCKNENTSMSHATYYMMNMIGIK